MLDPRDASQLEAMAEKLRDKFMASRADDMRYLAEITMALAAHIHRLEQVLEIVGRADRPKSATLRVDNSSVVVRPTGVEIKCNDIVLVGAHNIAIRAGGNSTIQAAGHLTVNGLGISQTGSGATLDGGTELHLRGTKIVETGQDTISIKANTIEIMAAGDLRLKGAKILEN